MDFTDIQLQRYSRNILLDEISFEGQKSLLGSKVLIIGVGGLGSPIAMYLASAGVGKIGLADGDLVDLTNLQRQIIHFTDDIGDYKTDSAKKKLLRINPEIDVEVYNQFLNDSNINAVIKKYDFVVDATDNFDSKFLINDACVEENIPFSHGGILRFEGQTMTVIPHQSACYRCVFKQPPPKDAVLTCAQTGILGSIAGILGTIQATEVIKYLVGLKDSLLTDKILSFDAKKMSFRTIDVKKDTNCKACS